MVHCDTNLRDVTVLRWRKGAEPRGGPYHELIMLAGRIPGGLAILLGEDFPGCGG